MYPISSNSVLRVIYLSFFLAYIQKRTKKFQKKDINRQKVAKGTKKSPKDPKYRTDIQQRYNIKRDRKVASQKALRAEPATKSRKTSQKSLRKSKQSQKRPKTRQKYAQNNTR